MTQHRDGQYFKSLSMTEGCSRAWGHKSALDLAGYSYTQFVFATTSASYDTSTWSTAAHVVVGFNTLLSDLEKKGILIKG